MGCGDKWLLASPPPFPLLPNPIHTDVRNHTMYYSLCFFLYKSSPSPAVIPSHVPRILPQCPQILPSYPHHPPKSPKSSQLVLPKNMIPYLCYLLSIYILE